MGVCYYDYTEHSMEKHIPDFSPEMIQQAQICLAEREEEIDELVDKVRGDYQSVRTTVLAEQLGIAEAGARKLLHQIDDLAVEEEKNRVQSSVTTIQQDPYARLAEQFLLAYQYFLQSHKLDPKEPIPKKLLDATVFVFFTERGEKQRIISSLARILLSPKRNIDFPRYFKTMVEGSPSKI